MKEVRLSTALMCLAVAAFEAVLLRDGTAESSYFLAILTWGIAIAATGLAFLRRGIERTWWRGFALGAWSYVALTWSFDERAYLVGCLDWIDPGRDTIWAGADRKHAMTAISALSIQASGAIGRAVDLAIAGARRALRRGGRPDRTAPEGGPDGESGRRRVADGINGRTHARP